VVKGKGMPDQHDAKIIGDCVIRITEVIFPKSLADNQRVGLKQAFNGIDIEGV
jgi:DnaJ-class molecular chaperone